MQDIDRAPGEGLLPRFIVLIVMGLVMLSIEIRERWPRWKTAHQTFGIRSRLRRLFTRQN